MRRTGFAKTLATTLATGALALVAASSGAALAAGSITPDDVVIISDPVRTPPSPPPAPSYGYGPDYVRVRGLSYAGTGCPAGSVAGNISPDRAALTLLMDSFVAEVGPGVSIGESRKNCQLLLDLDYPSGWQYALFTVDFRGYLSLDPGVTATQTARYYFQGQLQTAALTTTFRGPDSRDYAIRDTFGVSSVVWSPCGAQRALNLSMAVALRTSSPQARGLISTGFDSIDSVGLPIGIRWQRCR